MREQDIPVNESDIDPDGKFRRVHVEGDAKSKKNGWYVLHLDGRPAGSFGCNKRHGNDVKFKWTAEKSATPLTPAERKAWREEMTRRRHERDAAENAKHAAAAEQANRIWTGSQEATEHPYLTRKGISAHGLRTGVWEKTNPTTGEVRVISKNALFVPIRDMKKQIHSLQAIFQSDKNALGRDKDYLSNGAKAGLFYSIGKLRAHEGQQVILICEGFATGASLNECTGHAVIVALDAANLLPVAIAIRARFSEALIVMCADNDRLTTDNPGVKRAREAALAVSGIVAVPDFSDIDGNPTDFNDLHQREGAEAVRAVIDDVLAEATRVFPVMFVPECADADLDDIQFALDTLALFDDGLAARLSKRGVLVMPYASQDGLRAEIGNARRFMPNACVQVLAALGQEQAISEIAQGAGATVRLPLQSSAAWSWARELWDDMLAVTGSKTLMRLSTADADPAVFAFDERAIADSCARAVLGEADAAEPLAPERAKEWVQEFESEGEQGALVGRGNSCVDVHLMNQVHFSDWPHLSDKMKPLNTIPNLQRLLDNYGFTVRYDVIRKDMIVRYPGQRGTADNQHDSAVNTVLSLCSLNRLPKAEVPGFMLSIADSNPVNPVMDFITSKPWDGRSRLDDLLATVKTRPGFDRSLAALLMRRWFISAVAAAAKPSGFWSKGVVVFQGAQSLGKTAWFRSLLPADLRELLKVDATIDPSNKDTVISAVSHWLVELGELDGTLRKADIARLKGFITQDIDQFRRPYGRSEEKVQRRTVFFASVNPEQFLVDDANVRWWTVPVMSVDSGHSVDMQQFWSEVFEWYKSGERWWLEPNEEARLEDSNLSHMQIDPVEELIMTRYASAGSGIMTKRMTASEVLLSIGYDRPTQKQLQEAGKALRKLFGEPSKAGSVRYFNVPILYAGDHEQF